PVDDSPNREWALEVAHHAERPDRADERHPANRREAELEHHCITARSAAAIGTPQKNAIGCPLPTRIPRDVSSAHPPAERSCLLRTYGTIGAAGSRRAAPCADLLKGGGGRPTGRLLGGRKLMSHQSDAPHGGRPLAGWRPSRRVMVKAAAAFAALAA